MVRVCRVLREALPDRLTGSVTPTPDSKAPPPCFEALCGEWDEGMNAEGRGGTFSRMLALLR